MIKGRAQQTLTKVFDGSGIFSIVLTNENTSVPVSDKGLALNYSATPTDVYVYSGTNLLSPVASNPEAGEFTLTASGENIIAGRTTINGNVVSIGNASDMVDNKDSYSITVTASGKDFLGNPFSSQKKQVIIPLKHGDDATSYWVTSTSSVITKDVKGAMNPAQFTVSALSQSGFNDPSAYKGIFKVYTKTGISFSDTPDYVSSSPESSHTVAPSNTTNDIKVELYDNNGNILLDSQTIPVITQANGVISTKIQYTVTNTEDKPTDSASWSDNFPSVGKGQYLWSRTTFYYTDGSTAVSYSMGRTGADGASAPLLFLSSDNQAFTFSGDGKTPNPTNQLITFVANLQNIQGTATFVATPYLNGAAGTPIGLGGSGNSRTLSIQQFGSTYDSVVVKASLGSLSDTETVYKLKDGSNGIQGPAGADGKSTYIHLAYANSSDGKQDFSISNGVNKTYIGTYTDQNSSGSMDYTKYTWSLIKGSDGKNGTQGPAGADGKSTYVHIAYANSSDGKQDFSTTISQGKAYIGVLTDAIESNSTDYTKYTWSLVKGKDGTDGKNGSQGIQGPAGTDGKSTYVHFAYANSSDGKQDFSTTNNVGKLYIGVFTDEVEDDSNDYTKYTWSLIKGKDGSDGKDGAQGIQGPAGADGKPTYVHFAYANSSDGKQDFSTTISQGKAYIGVYSDNVSANSTDYTKYTWSLVKGSDGADAVSGWLTNESITLAADSNGNVPSYTGASGSFVVYYGINPVTNLVISASNTVGMTISTTGMNYSVTSMATDIAYTDLSVSYQGTKITKRLTLSKSKAGMTGADGTSVVNSTTPPKNPTQGQWWNDLSVTPNILKVYQQGNWVPYRIDAINLVAKSITADRLATDVLMASNVTYTNKNGTTTNLQTFDFDGIKTLLTDTNGTTYTSMESAVGSTTTVQGIQRQVNTLNQINLVNNSDFNPDLSGWRLIGPGNGTFTTGNYDYANSAVAVLNNTDNNGTMYRVTSAVIPIVNLSTISLAFNYYLFTIPSGGRVNFQISYLDVNYNELSWDAINQWGNTATIGKWNNVTINNLAIKTVQNAKYIVFAFDVRGKGTRAGFNRPIIVASQTVGDYVPGVYNNNDKIVTITQGLNGITQTVQQQGGDIAQLKLDSSQFSVDIKGAQDSANTANSKVDNLKVGGRNYVLNSSGVNASNGIRPYTLGGRIAIANSNLSYGTDSMTLLYTGNGSQEWYYALAEAFANLSDSPFDTNTTYTISVDVRGTAPSAAFRINNVFSPSVPLNNTSWTRLKYTFKFPDLGGSNAGKYYIRLNATGSSFTSGMSLIFRNFKLEDGNLPTAWSPAPEDVDSKISNVDSKANSAQNSANTAGTKADSAQNSANNAQATATDAKNLAASLKLSLDGYTFGITDDGRLVSGVQGSPQYVTLKGKVINLDSDTVFADNFITRLLSVQDATIGSTLRVSSGGSILSDVMNVQKDSFTVRAPNISVGRTSPQGYKVAGQGVFQIDSKFGGMQANGVISVAAPGQTNPYKIGEFQSGYGINNFYIQTKNYNNGDPDEILDVSSAEIDMMWADSSGNVKGMSSMGAGGFNTTGSITANNKVTSGTVETGHVQSNPNLVLESYNQSVVIRTANDYRMQFRENGYIYLWNMKFGSGGSSLQVDTKTGAMYVQSSATKFKHDIQHDGTTTVGDKLLTLDPATWEDKGEYELRKAYREQGIEPDHTIFMNDKRYYGLIAEDLVKAGLEEFVVREEDGGEVSGLEYDKVAISLIPLVREQRNAINELRTEIENLKENLK